MNWRKFFLLAVLLILVNGCFMDTSNSTPNQLPKTMTKIMALGDSITNGYDYPGGYRNFLWRSLQDKGCPMEFVGSQSNGEAPSRNHEGHSGWRIGDIHSQIKSWLTINPADIILLLIGTNDMFQVQDLPQAPQRLAGLLETIYQQLPQVKLYLGTLPPIGEPTLNQRVISFNQNLPSIVQSQRDKGRSIILVDIYKAVSFKDLGDGVHPTLQGHQKIAQAWAQALCP
jgi:lysophospholipase L1-like esterase